MFREALILLSVSEAKRFCFAFCSYSMEDVRYEDFTVLKRTASKNPFVKLFDKRFA